MRRLVRFASRYWPRPPQAWCNVLRQKIHQFWDRPKATRDCPACLYRRRDDRTQLCGAKSGWNAAVIRQSRAAPNLLTRRPSS